MIPLQSKENVAAWRAEQRRAGRAALARVLVFGTLATVPWLLVIAWFKQRFGAWLPQFGPADLEAAAAAWSPAQIQSWWFDPRAWAALWGAAWLASGAMVWLASQVLPGRRMRPNGDLTPGRSLLAWADDHVPYPWAAGMADGEQALALCGEDPRLGTGLGSHTCLTWMMMTAALMVPINYAVMGRLTGATSMPAVTFGLWVVAAGGVVFAALGAGRPIAFTMAMAGPVAALMLVSLTPAAEALTPRGLLPLIVGLLALAAVTAALLWPRGPRVLLMTNRRLIVWHKLPSQRAIQPLMNLRLKRQQDPSLMSDDEWLAKVAAVRPEPRVSLPLPLNLTLASLAWGDQATLTSAGEPEPVRIALTPADADALAALVTDGGGTVEDQRRSRPLAKLPAYAVMAILMVLAARPLGQPVALCMAGAEVLLPALGAANEGDGRILDAGWPLLATALPDEPVVWGMRAVTLHRLGRFEEAEEARQRAVELASGQGVVGRLELPPAPR